MKIRVLLVKMLGLLSVVRGYNLLLIVVAQYLTAVCVLSLSSVSDTLTDVKLFALVLSSAFSVAGGYIINAFYDQEKDLINTPQRVLINRLVGQNTQLTLYFLLNFLSIIAASYVSFASVVFFSGYIFLLWFYSHKLKKKLWLGSIVSAVLSGIPLLVILLYYKRFEWIFLLHGTYISLLILAKNLIKDILNLKGDFALGYRTHAVVYGTKRTKRMIFLFLFLEFVIIYYFLRTSFIGYMRYYFYGSAMVLLGVMLLLLGKKWLLWSYNLLRLIILCGVFSLILLR